MHITIGSIQKLQVNSEKCLLTFHLPQALLQPFPGMTIPSRFPLEQIPEILASWPAENKLKNEQVLMTSKYKEEEREMERVMISFTIVLVMKRPKAVNRKLVMEKCLVSKGKYHGTGESNARSFSHTTCEKEITCWSLAYLYIEEALRANTFCMTFYLKSSKP